MKKYVGLFAAILIVIAALMLSGCAETRKLSFEREVYFLLPGDSFNPRINVSPSNAAYTLSCANPKIAKADGGKITSLQEGITTITADSGGRTASARLVVIDDEAYTGKLPVALPEYKRISFIVEDYVFSSPMEVQSGMAPGVPNPILRGGYDLNGWYTDTSYSEKFDFNKPLNENTTVYGFWVIREAEYIFEQLQGKTYVSGLKFPKVPYTELVLPDKTREGESVAGIKTAAFEENASIKKVTVPSCYEYIEKDAFYACPSLEQVIFAGTPSIKRIGQSAFDGCTKLAELVLPPSLMELGGGAFRNCSALDIDWLPTGITSLPPRVFFGTAVDSVDLANITQILDGAFGGCTKLSAVLNTSGITKCGVDVFSNTPILNTALQAGAAYIGTVLVGASESTASFTLMDGVTLIADGSFSSQKFSDLIITINGAPPSYIGAGVFRPTACIITEDRYFSAYRTEGGQWYEYRKQVCVELTENGFSLLRFQSGSDYLYDIRKYDGDGVHLDLRLALPYAVRNVRAGAFHSTAELQLKLKSLTFGKVDNIAAYAINDIGTLLAIIFTDDKVPALAGNMSISKNTLSNGCVKIYVPDAKYAEWRGKEQWSPLKAAIFSDAVLNDGLAVSAVAGSPNAFIVQYFGDEEELTLPSAAEGVIVNIIAENAFRYNYTLKRLVISAGVTEIREAALAHNAIETIEFLSPTPPSLGQYFMYKNTVLSAVYVPAGAADGYRAALPQDLRGLIQER